MTELVPPRVIVGIDWSVKELQVCPEDPEGQVLWNRVFPHNGLGLADLTDQLTEMADGDPASIYVAIEMTNGPTVETLLERGFTVFGINPKQLDRFRDRFSPAGAKDDRRDAWVLADSLRTDQRAYRRLSVDAPEVIELREWSRMHEDLKQERVRLTNRLREQLRRYFPQMVGAVDQIWAEWFLDLVEQIPTPEAARRRRVATVAKILRSHRIRRLSAEDVLSILRQPPVYVAPGTVVAAQAHIRLLLPRVRMINRQLRECEKRLDALCRCVTGETEEGAEESGEQRDGKILRSFPGVGRIVLATLLAEAAQPLRARDLRALRTLGGIAPVTKRSGKRHLVLMRHACNRRLANALYHWARIASQSDSYWKRRYAEFRRRGHSHGRACRGIADRLLSTAMAALRTDTLYDPTRLSNYAEKMPA
jgi:transposase